MSHAIIIISAKLTQIINVAQTNGWTNIVTIGTSLRNASESLDTKINTRQTPPLPPFFIENAHEQLELVQATVTQMWDNQDIQNRGTDLQNLLDGVNSYLS